MAKLGYIWFWPNGGPYDAWWGDKPGSAAVDAFARTSRRVTERYSAALAFLGIEAARAALQMGVRESKDPAARAEVTVTLWPNGDDLIQAEIPSSVAELSPQERARFVLEVVDVGMRALASARGWPQAQLEQVRQQVLDHDLGFEMTGPWKQSPSRSHRVRLVARVTDDGWSDLCYEVADGKTRKSLGYTDAIKSPINSLPKFKRIANEMRWADEVTIERPDDWHGRYGSAWGPVDLFHIDQLHDWRLDPAPAPEHSPIQVTASVERFQDPDQPEIRFVGGGPTNDVPESYLRALHIQFRDFESAAVGWWARADRNLLQIQFQITADGPDQRIDVRRLKTYVSVNVRRRRDSLTPATGTVLAADDVHQVALAVAKRMGLGDPPI